MAQRLDTKPVLYLVWNERRGSLMAQSGEQYHAAIEPLISAGQVVTTAGEQVRRSR